jgi:hypothetical protein
MKTLQNTEKKMLTSSSIEDISKYHRELENSLQNVNPEEVQLTDDIKNLMDFNGYYTLNNANGAFFSIDTNMVIKKGAAQPIYDLSFIISLDGKNSRRYKFTGTFDGVILQQNSEAELGLNLDLTFTREDSNAGVTTSFSGSITLPSKSPTLVKGTTYNNPIKYDIYEGTYFHTIPANAKEGIPEKTVKALTIENGYSILFDYETDNGKLVKVPSFIYNLNMYYFSFKKALKNEEITYHLIMGTGSSKGLVAGNMTITKLKEGKSIIGNRSLYTIPHPVSEKEGFPNLEGSELADFSGYYSIPSIDPHAFFSIQAEYTNIDSIEIYGVKVSYSFDGKTSTSVYFNEVGMTFKDNTLVIPSEKLSITLDRNYDKTNRSLVSISGEINSKPVTGYTLFNPVPLTAFKGVTMKGAKNGKDKNSSLEIVNDNEIIFNGTTVKSFIYVPLMYILAYPITSPEYVFSFGSDGRKGNSCIITTVKTGETSYLYAVHNAS